MDRSIIIAGQAIKIIDNGNDTFSAQIVLDGIEATGVLPESGGIGSKGWLSSIFKAIKGIQGRKIQDATGVNTLLINTDGSINVKESGSLANNQTNKSITSNTNILSDFIPTKFSDSVLQVMSNTTGTLSLVIDGVSGFLNSGLNIEANSWYSFEISLLTGLTYNLQFSTNAVLQVKWQVK